MFSLLLLILLPVTHTLSSVVALGQSQSAVNFLALPFVLFERYSPTPHPVEGISLACKRSSFRHRSAYSQSTAWLFVVDTQVHSLCGITLHSVQPMSDRILRLRLDTVIEFLRSCSSNGSPHTVWGFQPGQDPQWFGIKPLTNNLSPFDAPIV